MSIYNENPKAELDVAIEFLETYDDLVIMSKGVPVATLHNETLLELFRDSLKAQTQIAELERKLKESETKANKLEDRLCCNLLTPDLPKETESILRLSTRSACWKCWR